MDPGHLPLGAGRRLTAALALAAAAAGAGAQSAAPAGATGVVRGVVYDSLVTAAPLRGAEVWLVGTPFRAVADSAGRFRLDGVPAGRYRLAAFHPLLDSLGVASPLVDVGVAGGDSAGVQIALPSERALYVSRCGRLPGPGEGLAIGLVLDVDDETPVASARVAARWVDYPLVRGRFVRTPRQAETTTAPGGQFTLCGIPNEIGLEVDAVAGGRSSGAVTVFLDERLVAFRQLHVARPDTAAVADADTAPRAGPDAPAARVPRRGAITLLGRVVNKAGQPVADAVVASDVAGLSTRTDSSGAFRMRGLAAGSQDLAVRAIGFEPAVVSVVVRRDPGPLTIVLDRDALALPSITVVGRRESRWDRTGFENRRWLGTGKFITREDVAARAASYVPDLLRGIAGLEVTREGYGSDEAVHVRRGSRVCEPDVYLDGLHVPDGASQLRYLVSPGRVVGMEVYVGMTAPAEFIRKTPPCGSIVIWTTWSSRR